MRRSNRWTRPVQQTPASPRKPRILVAGEFSAGKSELINCLIGESVLPTNVIATALPPVWLVRGDPALLRVDASGSTDPIKSLVNIDLDATQYCVLSYPAPMLEQMEIIDTPGNSDPNVSAESWQRMLEYADAVIWCTNATQAWRQSEKAVWQSMPDRLRKNSTLVITHADLITRERDTARVQSRVEREASRFFDSVHMVSLPDPKDGDRISAHLQLLCAGLQDKTGAKNEHVANFIASNPVTVDGGNAGRRDKFLSSVRPRRVSMAPKPSVSGRSGAQVVPLSSAPPRSTKDKSGGGRARALWNSLVPTDQNDAAAMRTAVEKLISALDAQETDEAGGASLTLGTGTQHKNSQLS